MARKSMFPLKMADDVQVRKLEELQEHFDFQAVYSYYDDGRLLEWLETRYYEEEAEKVKKLDKNAPDFKKSLHEIFGVEYSEEAAANVSLSDVSERNERLEKLRTITSDDKILAAVDRVAFDQEELADLLNNDVKVIYLCGDSFRIPGSKEGVTYIGVNNPKVEPPNEYFSKGIEFIGTDLGNDDIDDVIRRAKETTNDIEAFNLWRIAAEAGDAESQVELGKIYYSKQKFDKAIKYFTQTADAGSAEAQYWLGECYSKGSEVERDVETACDWYIKAAEQGHVGAQSSLGDYHYKETNWSAAFKWCKKAAKQGNAQAQYILGKCFYDGRGVNQDYTEAAKWYRKAAEQGQDDAKLGLENCYIDGCIKENKKRWTAESIRKAAEQGDAVAQAMLGSSYAFGLSGYVKNKKMAIEWCRKAAEQRHEEARLLLNRLLYGDLS